MNYFKYLPLAIGLLMAGCAVTQQEVAQIKQEKSDESAQSLERAKSQLKQESRMTRMGGNFIGDAPIELPYAASLPPVFFEKIVIRSKALEYGTVSQAAKNIALATGLPVRVNPDVLIRTTTNLPVNTGALNMPVPGLSGDNAADQVVRLDHQGTLLSYVKEVSNSTGIEWEYKDGAINFFRLVTKSFMLSSVNAGDVNTQDVMSKGGQATTGQTGGGLTSSTGGFNNATSVSTLGTYSVWKSIRPALESALSPVGKLAINEGSGTVTVTDTKDAVAKIGKIIETENTTLGRQVAIEVRVVRIDVSKQTQLGLNLSTVYSVLKGGNSKLDVTTTSQASQVSGSVGTMTFAAADPASRMYGSKVGVQALNQFGDVLSDATSSVVTTNRVPVMTGSFVTKGFLAQTTPAAGGVAGAGSGVPGLVPGSSTTGSFMRIVPTIKENNTVMLSMSVDISDLLGFGSASTGSGATLQQIQWANTSGTKTISNMQVNQDESMVMAGIGVDTVNSTNDAGVAGASSVASKNKSLFIVIVTPRVLKGI